MTAIVLAWSNHIEISRIFLSSSFYFRGILSTSVRQWRLRSAFSNIVFQLVSHVLLSRSVVKRARICRCKLQSFNSMWLSWLMTIVSHQFWWLLITTPRWAEISCVRIATIVTKRIVQLPLPISSPSCSDLSFDCRVNSKGYKSMFHDPDWNLCTFSGHGTFNTRTTRVNRIDRFEVDKRTFKIYPTDKRNRIDTLIKIITLAW